MSLCECGCGGSVGMGHFLSGHDQTLRIALERRVGGLLPLRHLVENAEGYFKGELTSEQLTQSIRGLLANTYLQSQSESSTRTTGRDEILVSARDAMKLSGLDHFTIPEVISQMKRRGLDFAESTVRTHVASRMCANAPDNHAVVYRDLERTDRGTYRLLKS